MTDENTGAGLPKPRRKRKADREAEAFMEVLLAFGAGLAGATSAMFAERRMVQLLGAPHDLGACVSGFNCPIHGDYNRRKVEEMKSAFAAGSEDSGQRTGDSQPEGETLPTNAHDEVATAEERTGGNDPQ